MPELLIQSSDTGEISNLSIDDEEVIAIGRYCTNDLCLPHLSVSNFHALIIPGKSGVMIKDLKSTNGIKVNGEPVQKQVLVHLDDITIGSYKISYFENRIGTYRVSYAETSTEPAPQVSGVDSPATQLPPLVRKNWLAIQKKFDYPVNAIGMKIDPSDTKVMQVWQREKIDEDGRLPISEHAEPEA